MKFSEAMEQLKAGIKVARHIHGQNSYFLMDGDTVRFYEPRLQQFTYDESIMVSDGWIIEDMTGEHYFYDVIPFLLQGFKAKLNSWDNSCIYLDGQLLVLSTIECFPYMPCFSDFVAEDWVVIE
jgi:hypothetical protein